MLHGENYFLHWAEAESFPEFSDPLPGPGPCRSEGLGDRCWGGVSERNLLGGSCKTRGGFWNCQLLPSIQEGRVKVRPIPAHLIFIDPPMSTCLWSLPSKGTVEPLPARVVGSKALHPKGSLLTWVQQRVSCQLWALVLFKTRGKSDLSCLGVSRRMP